MAKKTREYGSGNAPGVGAKIGDVINLDAIRDKMAKDATEKAEREAEEKAQGLIAAAVEGHRKAAEAQADDEEDLSGFRPAAEVLGSSHIDSGDDDETSVDIGKARTEVSITPPPPAPSAPAPSIEVPVTTTGSVPQAAIAAEPAKGVVDPPESIMLSQTMDREAAAHAARAAAARKVEGHLTVDAFPATRPDPDQPKPVPVPVLKPAAEPKDEPAAAPRKGMEAQELPVATPARLFWQQNRGSITIIVILGLILMPLFSYGMFEALRYLSGLRTEPVAVVETTETTEPTEPVTAPDAEIVPEPVSPPVVLPPPPLPPGPTTGEPGLHGASGTYVRMPARDAFPRSCTTSGGEGVGDYVRYFCGLHEAHGRNRCDCDVGGLIP